MPNIWATFVRKFITKNFLKQPNLVTLDWIKIGLQSLSYTLAQKLDVAPTRSLVTKEAKFSHKEEGTKIKSKMEISFSLSLSLVCVCVCVFIVQHFWQKKIGLTLVIWPHKGSQPFSQSDSSD